MECIECKGSEANKESGLCDVCEQKSMRKINGLLYLPALGLVLTIISFIIGLYDFILTVFHFFDGNEVFSYYLVGMLVLMVFGFGISLYAAWLFFKRKKGARRMMVLYYIMGLIIALCSTVFPAAFFNIPLGSDSVSILSSAIFGVVIWMPYFIFSRRINIVFCR